jgi:hypothetical protein
MGVGVVAILEGVMRVGVAVAVMMGVGMLLALLMRGMKG